MSLKTIPIYQVIAKLAALIPKPRVNLVAHQPPYHNQLFRHATY